MQLKISVVTAVFNRVSTIAESIDSIQSQSWENVEHIIQDGGSTDGTIEVIERKRAKSTKVTSESDKGIYDAINKGIERCSGEIIGLMHSDDAYANDYVLEKVASVFQNSAVDGVYGDLQYVDPKDPARVVRHWRAGAYNPSLLRRGWMPPHPTLYLRREVFERFGLYDSSFEIAADYDAILRYLTRGRLQLAYIPEVLVRMRLGGESNRSLPRIFQKSHEDLVALRRNGVGGIETLVWKNFRKIAQFR